MDWNDLVKDLLRVYIRDMDRFKIKNNWQARIAKARGERVTKICRKYGLDELELYLDDLDLLDALAEPRHKIGDIAFVKSEAIKGLTTPVMIVGIDYDVAAASDGRKNSREYRQSPEYKTQLVDIQFNYEKLEPRGVVKKMIIDECRCYDEDELISEEDADKLVTAYMANLKERISTFFACAR